MAKQNDDTVQPKAFASQNLIDAEKIFSIGELELLPVVWGPEKFRF